MTESTHYKEISINRKLKDGSIQQLTLTKARFDEQEEGICLCIHSTNMDNIDLHGDTAIAVADLDSLPGFSCWHYLSKKESLMLAKSLLEVLQNDE